VERRAERRSNHGRVAGSAVAESGDGLPPGRWGLFLLLILIVLMILAERIGPQGKIRSKIKSMSKRSSSAARGRAGSIQYLGTSGSISTDQASMPPARL
jgi:hypothetical protein